MNQHPPKSNGARVFAVGLAAGLVVGAGVALLTSPGTGEENRRAVRRRVRRWNRARRDAWDDLRHEFRRVARKRKKRDEEDG